MRTHFLVWVASCLMVTGASEATAQSSFTSTQEQAAGTSNALDVQDRIRARELEAARADVRRRLVIGARNRLFAMKILRRQTQTPIR